MQQPQPPDCDSKHTTIGNYAPNAIPCPVQDPVTPISNVTLLIVYPVKHTSSGAAMPATSSVLRCALLSPTPNEPCRRSIIPANLKIGESPGISGLVLETAALPAAVPKDDAFAVQATFAKAAAPMGPRVEAVHSPLSSLPRQPCVLFRF